MEVPKFGSFKPKTKTKTLSDDSEKPLLQEKDKPSRHGNSHRVEKRHRSGDRERDHHHHRRREDEDDAKRRRRDTHDDRHRSHDIHSSKRESHRYGDARPGLKQECQEIQTQPIAITQDEFEESHLFIVDRRGDSKNIEYGSLHQYSVPAYRRTGYGNLIGGPSSSKIDRDASNEKEICLVSSDPGKRAHHKVARLLSSKYGRSNETRLRFVSAAESKLEDGENDYIELSSFRKRKLDAESPEHEAGVDYRSIEGKAKVSNKPADEDLEHASDSDDAGYHDSDLRARQEGSLLSKKAKANPLELDLWLALVNHQSHLIRPGDEVSSFTTSERRTLADLRLSILNEAGKHISLGKPGRERLLLAMIEEGLPLWDKTQLAAKWKEVLKECPSSILLWTKYMDFVQYDHSSFTYDTCRDAYLQWLQILKTAHERSSGEERIAVTQTQVYALLRFTTFVRDAGYDELATAIWQILFEFHFFLPKQLAESALNDHLESLGEYWDSEIPRIGEQDAVTWAKFIEQGPVNAPQRTSKDSQPAGFDPNPPFASFAHEEAALTKTFLLPASTEDEDAMTDPFRCIIFDDLRIVVESLSMGIPKAGLISAFLQFAGLPTLPNGGFDTSLWSVDPHLSGEPDTAKAQARQETSFTLFESAFQPFQNRHESESEGLPRFVDRILDAIVRDEGTEGDSMREYCLAFKAAISPKDAPKAAKRLLKSRSSSLRLYNAFALIETRAGRMDKAMEVWTAALGMLPRLDSNTQDDAILLWHSRFLMQVHRDDEAGAVQTLLATITTGKLASAAAEEDSSHIEQLRLRRDLESGFDRMLLLGKGSHAVLYADLLAWVTYFTQDLVGALSSYNLHIKALSKSGISTAVEELQQCKARLLSLHIDRQRPYRPADFQRELAEALQTFPSNSILLDLHSRLATQDRLRSLVSEQKNSDPSQLSLIQWTFRLASELSRIENMSTGAGTINTVRATFSKALPNPGSNVAHCTALWTSCLEFELSKGDRQRARNVFLDGLRALPGVKAWAIMGMSSGVMEEGELRRVWEGMVERGLRLRVGVEEFV